VRTTQ